MELDGIMPPINPFDPSANRQGKIQRVVDRLKAFFSRFFSIADNRFGDSSDEEETVSENISVNYFGKETDEETDYPMAADETKLDYH
jgi:hypothetical protein